MSSLFFPLWSLWLSRYHSQECCLHTFWCRIRSAQNVPMSFRLLAMAKILGSSCSSKAYRVMIASKSSSESISIVFFGVGYLFFSFYVLNFYFYFLFPIYHPCWWKWCRNMLYQSYPIERICSGFSNIKKREDVVLNFFQKQLVCETLINHK